jgi:hypothetical protein
MKRPRRNHSPTFKTKVALTGRESGVSSPPETGKRYRSSSL